MKLNKRYSILLIGVIVLSMGTFLTPIHLSVPNGHNSDHEDDLQCSYLICECGHNRCTGNVKTCPCCGLGAPTTIKPTSYGIYQWGEYVSGNLASVYYDELNYLIARASWFWFIVFSFQVSIGFEFVDTKCDRIQVDIRDNAPNYNMMVHVYYTTGQPDHLPSGAGDWPNGWLSDGYYAFNIDGTRFLDSITINFYHGSFLGGDKYLKVDLCVAEPV